MRADAKTSAEYTDLQVQLLPPGKLWRWSSIIAGTVRIGATRFLRALAGLGAEWARVHNRVRDVLETEADPRLADETLAAWERNYGLPDPDAPAPTSTADRRLALAARVRANGGASPDYWIDLAREMGVTINVTNPRPFPPFKVGLSLVGEDLVRADWAVWYWEVVYPGATDADTLARLQALFERTRPAHTRIYWRAS